MRRTLAILGTGLAVGLAGPAAADSVGRSCASIDKSNTSSCRLVRAKRAEWQLETRVVVGAGAKGRVAALEERFCAQARRANHRARVTRWNDLPGQSSGARMDWDCAMPAVGAAPR